MKKRIKINGLIILLTFAAVVAFPDIFLRPPQEFFLDEAAKLFGILFIVLGQVIRTSARGFKSETSQEGRKLVIGGPYNMVRNPMYLGIVLMGSGIIIIVFQWWVALLFTVIFTARYIWLIFREEKKLAAAFGQEYLDYRASVSRFLPSLSRISRMDITAYLPLKLKWAKKEAGSLAGVLSGVLLLESWRDIRQEGLGVRFFAGMLFSAGILLLLWWLVRYLIRRTEAKSGDVSGKS